jgi:hypothetical protein
VLREQIAPFDISFNITSKVVDFTTTREYCPTARPNPLRPRLHTDSSFRRSAWLGLAWLGLAWLGLAWLGLAWLGLRRAFGAGRRASLCGVASRAARSNRLAGDKRATQCGRIPPWWHVPLRRNPRACPFAVMPYFTPFKVPRQAPGDSQVAEPLEHHLVELLEPAVRAGGRRRAARRRGEHQLEEVPREAGADDERRAMSYFVCARVRACVRACVRARACACVVRCMLCVAPAEGRVRGVHTDGDAPLD